MRRADVDDKESRTGCAVVYREREDATTVFVCAYSVLYSTSVL